MKATLEQAKQVAERLKKKYKHGKSGCPEWFKNAITFMEQDGSYSVAICIPNWSVPEEHSNAFLTPIDGVRISLRVVTAPKYNVKSKNERKENEKN